MPDDQNPKIQITIDLKALAIAGVVLAVIGGGWLIYDNGEKERQREEKEMAKKRIEAMDDAFKQEMKNEEYRASGTAAACQRTNRRKLICFGMLWEVHTPDELTSVDRTWSLLDGCWVHVSIGEAGVAASGQGWMCWREGSNYDVPWSMSIRESFSDVHFLRVVDPPHRLTVLV
jgi:hypothetical protein